ncbi:MAG: topoisomerase DNA-binding C4 zinc finger domain-containing protein [Lachnospiraceae bacterium]|nr:topoisomerase DNA-binding C4 zinc finger domain-containing protein [Lachnospiraceae bacterium]
MEYIRNKGRKLGGYVKDYVVFDLETTGFRFESDEIIEISAVKVQDSRIVDTYSTLVKPSIRIPASATKVNHITNDMVSGAPGIAEALEGFVDFVETGILVGHNIHNFDMNFVYDAAMQVFQTGIYNDYIDTLHLAKQCLPQLKHHRLSDVAEYFDISTEGAHRALNDCIINQKCYERLGELLKEQPQVKTEQSCPQCGGVLVKRKGRYGEFWGCSSFPRCRYTRNA